MFKIYDGREKFYQWDLDRKLIVEDPSIVEVHFCNRTDECSLVCETYVEDGITLVNVPNILLQTNWRIHSYGYDGNATKHEDIFEVHPRSKPADYIYTETEVKEWEAIVEKAEEALAAVDGKEDKSYKVAAEQFHPMYNLDDEHYPTVAFMINEIGRVETQMPTMLGELVDTSCYMEPINFARYAINDAEDNEISKTYLKRDEVQWKLLGWEKVMPAHIDMAGDAGVTTFAVYTGDLSQYSEIMARLEIPNSQELNTQVGSWRIGLSENAIDKPNYGNGYMMGVYGYAEWNLRHDLANRYVLTSHFIDGIHSHTEVVKDNYGGYKAYMAGGISSMDMSNPIYHATKLKDKNVYWFEAPGTETVAPFKFPVGTIIKVYGR